MPININTIPPAKRFAYFFRNEPGALAELPQLRIAFTDVDMGGGEHWPGFVLPSGKILAIAADDEGNGPGAIHVCDPARNAETLSLQPSTNW